MVRDCLDDQIRLILLEGKIYIEDKNALKAIW